MKTILFVSGGSGVGKNSILKNLFKNDFETRNEIQILKPYTNRPQRDEFDTKYIFDQLEKFENEKEDVVRISQIDWKTKYLYSIVEIKAFLTNKTKKILIINIDGLGRQQILNKISKWDFNECYIYVDCIDENELLKRIHTRINEEEKIIRLQQLKSERQYNVESDYIVFNGENLEHTIDEFEKIIKKILFNF